MKMLLEKIKELFARNMPVFFIGGLTVIVFLVIIFTSTTGGKNETKFVEIPRDDLIAAHTYSRGSANARVQVVEFSDFSCPACKILHPIMTKIFEDYSQDIRWSFRHFPLSQHKDSYTASVAAQAAGEQGKFWEYADILFENQSEFSKENLISYADILGLDLNKFESHLGSVTFNDIVKEDLKYGEKIGIDATPTFFVNGQKVILKEEGDLRKYIEKALGSTINSDDNTNDTSDTTEKATTIDPRLLDLYQNIDKQFGVLEINYVQDKGFVPKNSQAQAGQLVKWTNTTSSDLKFVQLMPMFKEFSKPRILKPGETMEFRLRLREKGLWTFKNEGDRDRGSILIVGIPVDYKPLIEIEDNQ